MRNKLFFSSLFSKSRDTWPWPSCKHPRTQSFRAGPDEESIFNTLNSVYVDSTESEDLFSESFSIAPSMVEDYATETVIRRLRSDRLLFDGGDLSSSILDEPAKPFIAESIALSMETEDPYRDFKASMEEIVAVHGIRDWELLEELLVWYLRVNEKKTHGYILGAFVDLLVGLASANSSSSSSSFDICSSSLSSSWPGASTSALSSFEEIVEEEVVDEDEHES